MFLTRFSYLRAALALVIAASSTPLVLSQASDDSGGPIATATIPESNEALILSTKIEEALEVGDYRLATELIEQLRTAPAGLVAAPGGRTYYPVWRQAFRQQQQFPLEAAELYRRLHDAEAQARFQQASSAGDVETLRELFYTYRLSTWWVEIGEELAALLMEQGAFGDAVEILREMVNSDTESSFEHRAMTAIALGGAGARHSAYRMLDELRSEGAPAGREERLSAIEAWINEGGAGEYDGAMKPAIEIGPAWLYEFDRSDAGREDARNLAEAAATQRRLPFQATATADDLLLFRRNGVLHAFDTQTLSPVWEATLRSRLTESSIGTIGGDIDDAALSARGRAVMDSHLRCAISAGFGKAYTIEWESWFDSGMSSLSRMAFPTPREGGAWNELVARNLEDGSLAWSTRLDSLHPLYDVMFQNAPIIAGERLIVPFVRDDSLYLAELDPDDGELTSETLLVGPPTEFNSPEVQARGGRCLIVEDATTLYAGTGHGVVAALSKDNLDWKWAATYPSMLAERLGRLWWMPADNAVEPNIDEPLLADDLLIVAPADSRDIFALDRFDGRERWRMPRSRRPYVIGVLHLDGAGESRLVMGGGDVACLDLYDPAGSPPIWRSAPLEITGRGAVLGDVIYVPTSEGIVALDGRTGKIVRDQLRGRGDRDVSGDLSEGDSLEDYEAAQNLTVAGGALYGLALDQVTKYPDLALLRERVDGAIGASDSAGGAIERGWRYALDGLFDEALGSLNVELADGSALSKARDRALTYVFVQLAREAASGREKLDWLQRASSLAATPEAAVRMATTVGRALEKSERWDDALRHYGEMLRGDAEALVAAPGRRRTAAWVYAAERIGKLRDRGRIDIAEELTAAALEGEETTRDLQRLRTALYEHPERGRIDQLLCLRKTPPEIKAGYLAGASVDGPEATRRAMCLERWDVDVSLGFLERGEKDRAEWEERYAQAEDVDAGDRADAIMLAARKQESARGEKFVWPLTRQWKIEQAELLRDERSDAEAVGPWLLTANFKQRRLELINAVKHQLPQRQTPDGIEAEESEVYAEVGRPQGNGRGGGYSGMRSYWPLATYGKLGAAPVRGGLVGLGLGPERYAGRRLWDYRAAEWNTIPMDAGRMLAAGPEGVYLAMRRDRIEMIGWEEGGLRWEREFPEIAIERLEWAADQLLLISQDKQACLIEGMFGEGMRKIDFGFTPNRIDLIGDTIVGWGRDEIAAFDGRTLKGLWRRTGMTAGDTCVVPESPWIAYRDAAGGERRLLDARDGRTAPELKLGRFDVLETAAVEGGRLYAAGRSARPEDEGEMLRVSLCAYEIESGAAAWRREFVTSGAVDATQLSGHPDYIPILAAGPGEGVEAAERPAIVLVDKRTGEDVGAFSIKEDYRGFPEASCEMRLLVMPSRIIVQASGNVIGYGNSALRTRP